MRAVHFLFCAFMMLALPAQAAEVKEIITEKGIKAWLVEEHSLPLVAVRLVFLDAGSASDPAGKESRSYLISGLLDQGAGDKDALAFQKAVADKAVQLGFSSTDDTMTAEMETISEFKKEAFTLLGEALTSPRFDTEAVERVRSQAQVVLQRSLERPATLAANAMNASLFGSHPYGRPALGTQESIAAVTVDDLKQYTSRYLTRGNIYVAVVGDITVEETKKLLDQSLSALPEKFAPEQPVQEIAPVDAPVDQRIEKEVPQSVVNFVFPGIKRNDPDYMTAFVVTSLIGGGGLESKLSDELREKRGLTYTVGLSLDPMLHAGLISGRFDTRNEQEKDAVAAMRSLLKDIHDKGITQKELDYTKQYLTGSFPLSLDSNSSVAAFLTTMQIYSLGMDYLDKRNAMIDAVDLASANRMIKRLINPEKLHVVVVGTSAEKKAH